MAAMISRFAGKTQRRTKTDVFVLLFFAFVWRQMSCLCRETKKSELRFVALLTYTGST